MHRYYFDIRDGEYLVRDEDGLEIATVDAAWGEAALSLADLAMDAIAMSGTEMTRREVAVEVRDDDGPVLVVKVSFLRNVQ